MDTPDSTHARMIRREILNQKRKKPRIKSISDGGESTNPNLPGHSHSVETPSNQGTLDGTVMTTQFRNTEHNEKRPLANVNLDSSHKVPGDILTTRKRAALAEIDMNSVVESSRTAEYTRRARRKRIANLFISRNQSMPETLCQMDENQQSFIVKGLLSGDFRHHKNESTISGGSRGNGTSSAVTLTNHNPRGPSGKGNIGASRNRPTLCEIDKEVEVGGSVCAVNDRTARRERMSKLFNSRNQSIPPIVLDKTVACSISAPALKITTIMALSKSTRSPNLLQAMDLLEYPMSH
ncbi:hypothetical protein PIB30_051382 [Stylosanthes scabra]|uniref:Uncharacterized protein n=1 Tax=Stylosanthes scabra TaxID=79078 RepID=A0ABU6SHR7_9FABA|nr:hypothetical protein [Stylosanthes scabra]